MQQIELLMNGAAVYNEEGMMMHHYSPGFILLVAIIHIPFFMSFVYSREYLGLIYSGIILASILYFWGGELINRSRVFFIFFSLIPILNIALAILSIVSIPENPGDYYWTQKWFIYSQAICYLGASLTINNKDSRGQSR